MSKATCFDFVGTDFARVAIVGSPGSGKTTLSLKLGEILGMQPVHLDRELWKPDWTLPSEEERKSIHDKFIAPDRWLIDGMWGSLVADRYKRATVVVHLDYNRLVCLARAYKRYRKNRGKNRFDLADGCLDKMDGEFVSYIWNFKRNVGKKLVALEQANPQVRLYRLSSPKQTEMFIAELSEYLKTK